IERMTVETATLPPLPDQKTKGGEFTDLSNLDLDAYESASVSASIPAGDRATVLPLAEAVDSHPELIDGRLGALVPDDDPFVARNEAGWRDGVLISIPAGVQLTEPIKIELPLDENGSVVYWRTLVVLEDGAEAEGWEDWGSGARRNGGVANSAARAR